MARTPSVELPTTGIDHLRSEDPSALKLWTVNGPKDRPGKISAVFSEDESKLYLLHQMNDGKFALFERVAIKDGKK